MDMETVCRNTDGITKTMVDCANATIQIGYAPDEITEARILSQIQRMGIRVIVRTSVIQQLRMSWMCMPIFRLSKKKLPEGHKLWGDEQGLHESALLCKI